MNRFLANTLGTLNALLAMVFIAGGALGIVGSFFLEASQFAVVLLSSLAIGLVLPALICGPIALLIDIRNTLVAIRDHQDRPLEHKREALSGDS